MNPFVIVLTSIISSSAVVGLFIFALKNYFLNALNKDLENHKYALQREVLKAQLVGSHSAEVYKKMFELIEISFGVVFGKLNPIQLTTDWSAVGADDVEDYLRERNASKEAMIRIKDAFLNQSSDRVQQLTKVIRILDNFELSQSHQQAKNFIIANSLFIDEEVEKKAFSILKEIYSGCTAFHMWAHFEDNNLMLEVYPKGEVLRKEIDNLKVMIKSILLPS